MNKKKKKNHIIEYLLNSRFDVLLVELLIKREVTGVSPLVCIIHTLYKHLRTTSELGVEMSFLTH